MYLEQDYGGGIGFYPVRSDRQSLELTGDLIHVSEHFYGYVPSASFAAAALREKYTIKLPEINKLPVTLSEHFAFVPPFNQSNSRQLIGGATVSMPITASWSTNLNFKTITSRMPRLQGIGWSQALSKIQLPAPK
jgi:hypothetical protein